MDLDFSSKTFKIKLKFSSTPRFPELIMKKNANKNMSIITN